MQGDDERLEPLPGQEAAETGLDDPLTDSTGADDPDRDDDGG